MRLWHKDFIPILPRQQLLAQWRELNSIYAKQDKHILINFIYEYPSNHLYTYSKLVIEEMRKRGYKINLDRFNIYFDGKVRKIPYVKLFDKKMNYNYLNQCYYNLQEKYECGGISQDEWKRVEEQYENCRK